MFLMAFTNALWFRRSNLLQQFLIKKLEISLKVKENEKIQWELSNYGPDNVYSLKMFYKVSFPRETLIFKLFIQHYDLTRKWSKQIENNHWMEIFMLLSLLIFIYSLASFSGGFWSRDILLCTSATYYLLCWVQHAKGILDTQYNYSCHPLLYWSFICISLFICNSI